MKIHKIAGVLCAFQSVTNLGSKCNHLRTERIAFETLEGCKRASAGGENVRRETAPTTQAIIIVNYVGRFKENSKGLLKYYASSSNQNTTLAKLTVSNSLLCHQKPKKISLSGIG